MSLDKAIEHGKEKRKPYYGAQAIDCTCRPHGSCEWCRSNRLYQQLKMEEASRQALEEFKNKDDKQDKMIRATRKSDVTQQDLIDTFNEKGLIGVYNLGLKNMLDYLNGN